MWAVLVGRIRYMSQVGERKCATRLILPLASCCDRPKVSDGRGPYDSNGGRSRIGGFANSNAAKGVVTGEVEGGKNGGVPAG